MKQEIDCEDRIIEIYKKIIKKAESFPNPDRTLPYGNIGYMRSSMQCASEIKCGLMERIRIAEECQSDEFNAPKIESSEKVVQSKKTSLELSKKALDSSIRYRDTIAAKLEDARKELASAIAERDAKMR